MNNKLNLDEYIIMIPQEENVKTTYLKHRFGEVTLQANILDISQYIYQQKVTFIETTNQDTKSDSANIMVICEKPFIQGTNVDDIPSKGGFIKKDDPRYIPGLYNKVYTTNSQQISIQYYPYNALLQRDIEDRLMLVACGNYLTATYVTKMAVKYAISGSYKRQGFYSLHSSAVCRNQKGYLFLAGGRAGKTTIFMNLISRNFYPINDDMVFWKINDDGIELSSAPILPNVREESIDYIMNLNYEMIKKYPIGLGGEYNVDPGTLYNKDFVPSCVLKAIFLPELGYKETQIIPIEDSTKYKKRILRACITHQKIDVNEDFALSIRYLMQIPFYKLNVSNNSEEFYYKFNHFINKHFEE